MKSRENLSKNLEDIKTRIYDKVGFEISQVKNELEGTEYDACRFELNGNIIFCRSSKITPKKVGQFVTCWKRNTEGETAPYSVKDELDFLVINVKSGSNLGQFVFPKSELISKNIITSEKRSGKRGFRIYPKWDVPNIKQAEKTQKWQLKYFYEINESIDLKRVKELYK